jgi:glycosyltransferase involved in cell wall biosynthesis
MHVLLLPISYPNSYNRQSHVFFEEQARALSAYGIKVGVLAIIPISLQKIWNEKRLDIGLDESESGSVSVFRYQFPALPKMWRVNSWLRTWIGKRVFHRYRDKHGLPDITHVHVSLGGEAALWLWQHYRIPYVVTEHYTAFVKDQMRPWQIMRAQQIFNHSKRNIAVSNEFKTRLEKDYQVEFEYIPNIVDTHFFIPTPEHSGNRPARKFLNVGNLKPQKSQDLLIRAFARCCGGRKDFTLTIAGSGPEEAKLKRLALKLGLCDQVSFFGQASREDVLRLMQKNDCFVLSSTFETFGVVVIEAMSCGLPVIATRSGGPESIITNSKLGILCEINESELCDALQKVSTTMYDSKYIRDHAVSHFSAEVVAKQLRALYRCIVN